MKHKTNLIILSIITFILLSITSKAVAYERSIDWAYIQGNEYASVEAKSGDTQRVKYLHFASNRFDCDIPVISVTIRNIFDHDNIVTINGTEIKAINRGDVFKDNYLYPETLTGKEFIFNELFKKSTVEIKVGDKVSTFSAKGFTKSYNALISHCKNKTSRRDAAL